jgi:hypothetical protein
MRLNNLRKDQPKDEVIHDDHYENNKQQHQHIYASMDGPKLEASTRSEQGSKIHGNLLFEVGVVIALAIFFRRFWVLHGISLLLISRMLRLCVAWTTYFSDSGILTEIISLGKQLSRTVFKETEKIFQGDSFRLWVMGSSFQVSITIFLSASLLLLTTSPNSVGIF